MCRKRSTRSGCRELRRYLGRSSSRGSTRRDRAAQAASTQVGRKQRADRTATPSSRDSLRRGTCYGLVTGASGTGKTSLCHALTAAEGDARGQLLYLSASRFSLLSVVRYVAQVLRAPPRRSSALTIKALVDVIKERTTRPVLWIDEADRVPVATLTELRSPIEFDPAPQPLLRWGISKSWQTRWWTAAHDRMKLRVRP